MCLVFFRYIICRYILRRKCCNLHCNIGHCFLDCIIYNISFSFYNNADTSTTMSVGNNTSVVSNYLLKSSDVKVLADLGDLCN